MEGRRYVDLCLAFGPLLLGHAPPEVVRAVQRRVAQGSLFGACVPEEVELAEAVQERFPSMERMRFVSTGGEAASSVVRLARGATGKAGLVKVDGGFHGSVDPLLVRAGSGAAGLPSSAGVISSNEAPTYIVPFNDLPALERLLKEHPHIGLVLLEPVLGNMGVVLPEEGYLEGVRALTERYGTLLAFDEVITGFRVGPGGAQGRWKVRPDLTMLGKVVGGGLPLAVYGGRRDLMDLVAPTGPVYQAGTYSGNPLSLVAGSATLRALTAKRMAGVEEGTRRLVRSLERTFEEHGLAAQVPQVGSLFSIFLSPRPVRNAEDARGSDGATYLRLARGLLDHGVHVPQSAFEALFLSTSHGSRERKEVVAGFEGALRELKDVGRS